MNAIRKMAKRFTVALGLMTAGVLFAEVCTHTCDTSTVCNSDPEANFGNLYPYCYEFQVAGPRDNQLFQAGTDFIATAKQVPGATTRIFYDLDTVNERCLETGETFITNYQCQDYTFTSDCDE